MFDFVNITFVDVLDILLVAFLIFWIIKLVRGTAATRIFSGILILYIIWIVARALDMKLMSFILGQLLGVGVIALVIIFQPEIRRFFLHVGRIRSLSGIGILTRRFIGRTSTGMSTDALEEVTSACRKMSETKTGALIILKHLESLNGVIETGDLINANINRRLIENIFFKNTPLHDGAMIMSETSIIAARCTLPITERQDVPPRYGMRHRAAIGMTEASDAAAIVVSEETGEISFVVDGNLKTVASITELRLSIENFYKA